MTQLWLLVLPGHFQDSLPTLSPANAQSHGHHFFLFTFCPLSFSGQAS